MNGNCWHILAFRLSHWSESSQIVHSNKLPVDFLSSSDSIANSHLKSSLTKYQKHAYGDRFLPSLLTPHGFRCLPSLLHSLSNAWQRYGHPESPRQLLEADLPTSQLCWSLKGLEWFGLQRTILDMDTFRLHIYYMFTPLKPGSRTLEPQRSSNREESNVHSLT